jgi:hypothetical protein
MYLEKEPAPEISAGVEGGTCVIAIGEEMGIRAFRDPSSMPSDGGILTITAGLLTDTRETSRGLPKEGSGGDGNRRSLD